VFGHIVPSARPMFVELFRMREHRAKQCESCSLIWGLETAILQESWVARKTRQRDGPCERRDSRYLLPRNNAVQSVWSTYPPTGVWAGLIIQFRSDSICWLRSASQRLHPGRCMPRNFVSVSTTGIWTSLVFGFSNLSVADDRRLFGAYFSA
jgi:hypothetical protein